MASDPTGKDGYYIKNANKLNTAPLPDDPQIVLQIHPGDAIYSDALISESMVVSIVGLDSATTGAADTGFGEIYLPIDEGMLCLDNGAFMTEKAYALRAAKRFERIFLLVSDVRNSPDPARIFADVLRYEELDYGFCY